MSSGNYKLGNIIARGSRAEIVEASDLKLHRMVAMKLLPSGLGVSPEQAQCFIREAEVLGRLEHPNIVPIHDLGSDEHGHVFYTMKLVKGTTLLAVLDSIKAGKYEALAEYPLSRLLTIFQKVCDAVLGPLALKFSGSAYDAGVSPHPPSAFWTLLSQDTARRMNGLCMSVPMAFRPHNASHVP